MNLCIHLSSCLSIGLSIYLSIYQFGNLLCIWELGTGAGFKFGNLGVPDKYVADAWPPSGCGIITLGSMCIPQSYADCLGFGGALILCQGP